MRNLWPYNIEPKHWRSHIANERVKRRKSLKACDKTV